MQIIYRHCAGLDVHEKSISACIRIVKGKQVETVEATFPTFSEDLEQLRDWLARNRIQRVAMESTGVYWRPGWNILERKPAKFELVLLNPQHVKALPGHKTDRVDATRIAELTQYGLVRASFVPPEEIRELRDLVRQRVHLQQDRSRVSSRIHRLLELQNIKLSSVLTKMTTHTARAILEGLATSKWIKPESLALLATHKRVRPKREQLQKALRGCKLTDHFQFLLRELLEELDRLMDKMKLLEERIAGRMAPYAALIDRLCEIPGVDKLTAWTLIAEIGSRVRVQMDAEPETDLGCAADPRTPGRVFPNPVTGRPYHQESIQKRFLKPAGEKAGLGFSVGWHTFRHTYRAWLDDSGAPMTVQQQLMRHASIQTTMNVYGSAMPNTKREANRKIVQMVLGEPKTPTGPDKRSVFC